MKKIIFTLMLGFAYLFSNAQEQAVYSQYHLYPILVNPGATGFDNKHQFVLNTRKAWTGFAGAPSTYTLMYNGPMSEKLALGAGIFSEKIGDLNVMRLQLNYAFRFKIQAMQIGLGLSTEFLNKTANNSLLDNPTVDTNDQPLEDMVGGQKIFDASVGIHGLYDKRFFISFSLPNAIRARLDQAPVVDEEKSGSLFQFYMYQMGYIFDVKEHNFKVIPSLALRKVRDVPYQIDFNVQGRFLEEKLIAGLTFRPSAGGAASFLIGTKYKQLQMCYSYDVGFTKFQSYSAGSHELSFSFAFDPKVKKIDETQRY
jgi:type IX secretion system PorP/SprF family membrane protein